MKRLWMPVLVLLSTLAIASAAEEEWKAPARAAKKKNPVATDARSLASGKLLYDRECASCHGAGGKGDGPSAKDLERPAGDLTAMTRGETHTDGELFWKITEGKKPMPALGEKLSEPERWDVVNYIRGFSAGSKP